MFSLKLVHKDLEHQINLSPGKGCLWIIESPEYFMEYIQDLYKAIIAGEESNFVLSLKEKKRNFPFLNQLKL